MFNIKERVDAVKAIPDQIRFTMYLALTAILIGLIAISMSAGGIRRAH